jgi:hypothetical protein
MILLVGFSGHFSFPVSRTSEHLEHFTITELQDVNIAYICIPFVLFRQLSSIGPIDFFFEQNKPDALSRPDPLFLLVFTCSYLFLFLKENSIATSESRKSAQLTNHAFVFIVYANIIYIYTVTSIRMYTIYPPKVCTGLINLVELQTIFEDRSQRKHDLTSADV